MRAEQWQTFKRAARGEPLPAVPLALIADSPWIPGWLGVSHLDYFLDPECWFQANLRLLREFPEIIFFPSWWVEYGMAAEPTALGAKPKFWAHQTPSVAHSLHTLDELDRLTDYDVTTDGFMALALHRIRMHRQRIRDAGYILPVVTARGPLCTAAFVRGQTELMLDLMEQPEKTLQLVELTTRLTIDWLKAQVDAMGDTVEGIFLLDDIVGFLNPAHYAQFAHPFLKRICEAFPKDWIKVYHNDASILGCLESLPEAGFHVLNWGRQPDIATVRERVGARLCLMGNVNPLDPGVRGTPDQVKAEALRVLRAGEGRNMILSFGGGLSTGTPVANIRAMSEAVQEFHRAAGT